MPGARSGFWPCDFVCNDAVRAAEVSRRSLGLGALLPIELSRLYEPYTKRTPTAMNALRVPALKTLRKRSGYPSPGALRNFPASGQEVTVSPGSQRSGTQRKAASMQKGPGVLECIASV